jgi:lipopolysaccharide export system permease protein
MPRLLYTYLTNQVLTPFYASLVILTSIFFLQNIIPALDILLDYNISFSDFIRFFAYITPQLLLFALPMASMMGVVLGAVRLNNDREMMIMKSGGISFYQMLPPIIAFALCASLLSGLVSVYLIPAGNKAKADLIFRLAQGKIEKSLQEKMFSESLGDIVLYVDKIDQKKKLWQGVYISDMRDRNTPLTIMARTGIISHDLESGYITVNLSDGSLHRNNGKTVESIRFQHYRLRLPVIKPTGNPLAKTGKYVMTQAQLLEQADLLGRNTKEGAEMLNEYHMRLAIPVGCFILSLLGFPLGLIAGPGQRAIGIPIALCVFTFYYLLLIAGNMIGKTHLTPPILAMWLPNTVFLIITSLFIQGTAKESFINQIDKISTFLHSISLKLNMHSRKNS